MIDAHGFWKWAFSDFLSNSLRGVLAEYIVATALNCTNKPRIEWDAYDLKTSDGIKVEVRSSAYLQTWQQKKPSSIRFDIGPKQAWVAETNTSNPQAVRTADVYVFGVFSTTERDIANPLDLTQWFFIVCPTTFLENNYGTQKSVSLASLEQKGLKRIPYNELAAVIHKVKPLS